MNNFQLILEDLRQEDPMHPTILPPFYAEDSVPLKKVKSIFRQFRRAKVF